MIISGILYRSLEMQAKRTPGGHWVYNSHGRICRDAFAAAFRLENA